MTDFTGHTSICTRSNRFELSQSFCNKFVKGNTFAGLHWDVEEGELEFTFYPSDSDVASRIPIAKQPGGGARIYCAKFCKRTLRSYKMQKYCDYTIDVTKAGDLIVKFKLEKIL
ncbi:hypothetical protein LCGC14_1470510 [marine sediment metagenome]|uniref:Uncharacterized protein n=1 Tax=marine sediment metagenome TaxID=412755 RepID=A0A0F9JCG6_9ZZZZ